MTNAETAPVRRQFWPQLGASDLLWIRPTSEARHSSESASQDHRRGMLPRRLDRFEVQRIPLLEACSFLGLGEALRQWQPHRRHE